MLTYVYKQHFNVQGGSNMTGTDLCVNKPHCTASAQCGLFTHKSVPVIFEPPCICKMYYVNSLRINYVTFYSD